VTQPIPTTDSNRNRVVLFVALGVVTLLAAVFLVPKLLSGGGGSDDLGAPPDASGSSASTTSTTTADALALEPAPEAFSTKNPFTPLVDTSPAAAATGASTTGDETSGVPSSTDGTGTATGTGTGTGTSTEPTSSGKFSLIDVYAGPDGKAAATVEVDGQMYTVSEGETFAGGYRVVSLSVENKSGVFTSPSDGGTFTPTAGESVLK
jgi:hypothetical protein